MKRYLFLFIIGMLHLQYLYPCGSAYQFKIFPVGMIKDTIVTIDVQIWRMDNPAFMKAMEEDETDKSSENISMFSWLLKSHVTKYNKNQQVLHSETLDSIQINTFDYTTCLRQLYQKNLIDVLLNTKQIRLFIPEYISFCEFNTACDLVVLNNNQLIYNKKRYPLKMLDISNKGYFGFNNFYFQGYNDDEYLDTEEGRELYNGLISGFAIGSVRKYKCDNGKELIFAHLARGHELAMGWITHDPTDPRLKKQNDGEAVDSEDIAWLMKEYVPEISFNSLHNAVYEEPLLHHGYGFDVFIVN